MKIVDNELAREVILDLKNALEIEIKSNLRKKIEKFKIKAPKDIAPLLTTNQTIDKILKIIK